MNGDILDVGGTKSSSYQKEIGGNHTFTVVNIDENYGYDLKFSLEKPFPLEDGSYDHVLCLNVLERIYDHVNVLRESYRILKPGGSMIHFTPFLVQEHEGPYDFSATRKAR